MSSPIINIGVTMSRLIVNETRFRLFRQATYFVFLFVDKMWAGNFASVKEVLQRNKV